MQQQMPQQTLPTILCCLCGVPVVANPSNMCANCLSSQVDITEGIPKSLFLTWCRNCERYLIPPKTWVTAALESRELLNICLKRVKGLNKVKLVDAAFVWTEPHSRRVKVKITIQKEVFNGAILQQSFVVEYVVQYQMCLNCQRTNSDVTWKACVQIRQRADHKRTFLYLEQLMLKHNAHVNTINIKELNTGLDLYYSHRSHALKAVDFLNNVVPLRYKASEHLVSHDASSNTFNYKYSFMAEIAPVCRNDLVVLPPKVQAHFGGMGPVVICTKISNVLQFVDPNTLQVATLNSTLYWKSPFRSVAQDKHGTEFMVIDVEPSHITYGKFMLAEVTLARLRDMATSDQQYIVRTHIGNLLQPGDTVLAYDLTTFQIAEGDLNGHKHNLEFPDVVIIKKTFEKKHKRRIWKLKRLDMEEEEAEQKRKKKGEAELKQVEMERFLNDLEEDKEMRHAINLYKNEEALAQGPPSEIDENEDNVRMDELLDELEEFAIGGEGAEGAEGVEGGVPEVREEEMGESEEMMDGEHVIHGAPY